MIAEEVEPTLANGERVFARRGKGVYELFYINQGKTMKKIIAIILLALVVLPGGLALWL